MAIKTEEYMTRDDGVKLVRTYSDDNRFIVQAGTGRIYRDAIDPVSAKRTYIEGEPIPEEELHPEED